VCLVTGAPAKGNKQLKLEDVLNMLAAGFLRGGTGFLKAGEMIKGGTNVNRDIRVGVTHVCQLVEQSLCFHIDLYWFCFWVSLPFVS